MPAASTSVPSIQVSGFGNIGLLTQHNRLVCDSCSSGQCFAFGFLQTPPRDGCPCRLANSSPCRACRGLSPPSECALPGAQSKCGASDRAPHSFQAEFCFDSYLPVYRFYRAPGAFLVRYHHALIAIRKLSAEIPETYHLPVLDEDCIGIIRRGQGRHR